MANILLKMRASRGCLALHGVGSASSCYYSRSAPCSQTYRSLQSPYAKAAADLNRRARGVAEVAFRERGAGLANVLRRAPPLLEEQSSFDEGVVLLRHARRHVRADYA